ncbi:ADP-ribose pyrophosphatase YjhB, NUDIX family [Mucilaginibacter mallensis]|uniref:ADP-ribose pyrophosphatase YjhB, NUDIX family n=2 Tax=Mucilaginibacter mallensis TaxID=652787 RepID=A0A1H2B9I1_MUCMA|nr:ADP-ribose pyrophosphatase YjhB, NUDIX family [Mucilaginibacter mallensis]
MINGKKYCNHMSNKNYLDLLDELRSIAQLGLNYSKNHHDIENYNRLLQLAADSYSDITGLSSDEIKKRFKQELGYVTPKVGVNGALFNEQGQLLLELRSDDLLWGMPGGWVDIGESPDTAIKREFMEETNLVVEPTEIIKFYTRLPGEFSQPHTSVHIVYYCKYISGDLKKSRESLELNYMDHTKITNWHKDHGLQAQDAASYFNKLVI